jgi:hypothetical protein
MTIDATKLTALFPGENGAAMTPGTYQLSIFVKLLDPHALYEFGYPNYQTFGRHLLVGFDVVATDAAKDIAKKIYEALELAVVKDEFLVGGLDETDEDNPVVGPLEDNATVVAIRANHYGLRFEAAGIALYDETTCDSCIGEYLPTVDLFEGDDPAAEVVVEGVEPFATGQWLIENLRFPTYPNVRWAAPGFEDRPVPGQVYVQYSFAYDSPRPQFGGLSGVGQKVDAVTRHIYYVPESLTSDFEGAFRNLGVEVVETMPEVTDPDGNSASGGSDVSGGEEVTG